MARNPKIIIPFLLVSATMLAAARPVPAAAADLTGVVTVNGSPAGDYGIVYLVPEDLEHHPPKPETVTIVQKGFAFHPAFLIVTTGSTIRFENEDNEIHNAKSYSRPNAFDIGAHFPGTVKTVVLAKPGLVTLRCKVHHQMRGTVLVVPSSYFAKTNKSGRFRLKDVPAGNYKLIAWFSGMDDREMKRDTLEIKVGKNGSKPIRLPVETTHAVGPLVTPSKNHNWRELLVEIDAELREGLATYRKGQADRAASIVLAAYYQKFGKTGLRSLISQELGEGRGRQLEFRFLEIADTIRKSGKPAPAKVDGIQSQIRDLNRQLSIDLTRFDLDPTVP
jgi:plastocyanin